MKTTLVTITLIAVFAIVWRPAAAQRLRPDEFLPEMNQPIEPVRLIIGNIYYVGTNGVSSFLVVTPEGHILLDSGFNQTVSLIRRSVVAVGFRFEEVRVLLRRMRTSAMSRAMR